MAIGCCRRERAPRLALDHVAGKLLVQIMDKRGTYVYDLHASRSGSSGLVRETMCHLLGAGYDPLARQAAVDLGIGMQLTNILRDLSEDLNNGRVYLPADELAAHGSSREHLLWLGSRVATDGPSAIDRPFRELMRAQIGRARAHYQRGLDGIYRLPADGRFAIFVAGRLYAAILDVIGAAEYDVFSRRAATSTRMKVSSTARWWLALRLRPSETARLLAPEVAHS